MGLTYWHLRMAYGLPFLQRPREVHESLIQVMVTLVYQKSYYTPKGPLDYCLWKLRLRFHFHDHHDPLGVPFQKLLAQYQFQFLYKIKWLNNIKKYNKYVCNQTFYGLSLWHLQWFSSLNSASNFHNFCIELYVV